MQAYWHILLISYIDVVMYEYMVVEIYISFFSFVATRILYKL